METSVIDRFIGYTGLFTLFSIWRVGEGETEIERTEGGNETEGESVKEGEKGPG